MVIFVCSIDESAQPEPGEPTIEELELVEETTVQLLDLYSIPLGGYDLQLRKLKDNFFRFMGDFGPTLADDDSLDGVAIVVLKDTEFEALVAGWTQAIIDLCTAHDKDAVDAAEHKVEDLLTPLIEAPGKQLKEFWRTLQERLEADPRVPFMAWKLFQIWGKAFLDKAEEMGVPKLKRVLAGQIAEMVESDVRPDLVTAITDALCWRGEERLQEVKGAIEKGGRARLKGRESCLFLEVLAPASPCECGETHGVTEQVVATVML